MGSNKMDKKTKQNRDAENPQWRKEIGLRISNAREKCKMSQNELADLLGVNRVTLTYWENGTRDIKTTDIVRLADVLGVSCDYLLRGISSENLSISEETGLSEKAITTLKTLNSIKMDSNAVICEIDAINRLVEAAENCDVFATMTNLFHLDTSKLFTEDAFGEDMALKHLENSSIATQLFSQFCVLSPNDYYEFKKKELSDKISKTIEAIFIGDNLREELKRSDVKYSGSIYGIVDYNSPVIYTGIEELNRYNGILARWAYRPLRQNDLQTTNEVNYADNNETE